MNFPTPALQSYILANVPAAANSLYQKAFAAYQSSPAYSKAVTVTTGPGPQQDSSGNLGCGNLAGVSTGTGTFGGSGGIACIETAYSNANNINKEWLFTGRGDWVINDKNRLWARYKVDHGTQPTSTSTINPLFSAVSIQPENEGQMNETVEITPNMTNSFTMAGNWYSAYFGPASPAASAAEYPDNLSPDLGIDGSGTNTSAGLTSIGVPYYLTQGRDVTQYQLADDWTYVRGKNSIKAGANFRRDLVTDYDQQIETVFPYVQFGGLADYSAGQFSASSPYYQQYDSFNQAYSNLLHAHLAFYNLGVYVQDELQALPTLKLTLGARVDRTGNPLCHDNCFSQYQGTVPSGISSSDTTGGYASPYDIANGGPISASNAHPFSSIQPMNFQARAGFNYSPDPKTEIRGGIGMFADLYPAGFLDNAIQNFPNYNPVVVQNSGIYAAGTGAGTVRNDGAAANAALQAGFGSGAGLTSIFNTLGAAGIPFTPPAIGAYFPTEFKVPEVVEYSFQVQRQLGRFQSVNVTYAGNHGYNMILNNPYANPSSGTFSSTGLWTDSAGYQFGGYGATPVDPRFSRITEYTNNGYSYYNALQLTYKIAGHGFTGEFSYTWSHDLDTISNGGVGEPFNSGSLSGQLTPDLKVQNLNYSNADYDIRNNVVGDLVYAEPNKFDNPLVNAVAAGWTVGIKTYARSGMPFSVTNGLGLGSFATLGTSLMPDQVASVVNTCGNNPHQAVSSACLQSQDFYGFTTNNTKATVDGNPVNQTDFGNTRRNSFYGPHYVDTDLSMTKQIIKAHGVVFLLGANAYNVFNHANFSNPDGVLGPNGFGTITSTVAPPTSPYGSFQGAAVTQRVVTIHGNISF